MELFRFKNQEIQLNLLWLLANLVQNNKTVQTQLMNLDVLSKVKEFNQPNTDPSVMEQYLNFLSHLFSYELAPHFFIMISYVSIFYYYLTTNDFSKQQNLHEVLSFFSKITFVIQDEEQEETFFKSLDRNKFAYLLVVNLNSEDETIQYYCFQIIIYLCYNQNDGFQEALCKNDLHVTLRQLLQYASSSTQLKCLLFMTSCHSMEKLILSFVKDQFIVGKLLQLLDEPAF